MQEVKTYTGYKVFIVEGDILFPGTMWCHDKPHLCVTSNPHKLTVSTAHLTPLKSWRVQCFGVGRLLSSLWFCFLSHEARTDICSLPFNKSSWHPRLYLLSTIWMHIVVSIFFHSNMVWWPINCSPRPTNVDFMAPSMEPYMYISFSEPLP